MNAIQYKSTQKSIIWIEEVMNGYRPYDRSTFPMCCTFIEDYGCPMNEQYLGGCHCEDMPLNKLESNLQRSEFHIHSLAPKSLMFALYSLLQFQEHLAQSLRRDDLLRIKILGPPSKEEENDNLENEE